jgi:hypothetical protein
MKREFGFSVGLTAQEGGDFTLVLIDAVSAVFSFAAQFGHGLRLPAAGDPVDQPVDRKQARAPAGATALRLDRLGGGPAFG